MLKSKILAGIISLVVVLALLTACCPPRIGNLSEPTKEKKEEIEVKEIKGVNILSHETDKAKNAYRVSGQVKNSTNKSLTGIKINATFYDSEENIIHTDFSYTHPKTLEPQQIGLFDIAVFGEEASIISSSELVVVTD